MNAESQHLAAPVNEQDHVQGSSDAPVTLVEYADYECPYSAAASRVVSRIKGELANKLRFVYRHFPLTHKHPHAMQAAEAAEAAHAQGKFWEMHDLLYNSQDKLERENLISDAESFGLDTRRFALDIAEHRYVPRIEEYHHSGVLSGVTGTPTFFINGILYEGKDDYDSLMGAIREAMRACV